MGGGEGMGGGGGSRRPQQRGGKGPDKRQDVGLRLEQFYKGTDIKQLNNLKPMLYEYPELEGKMLETFNRARASTFGALNIRFTQPEFVQSITDRSAALMAMLYFKLLLEKATLKKNPPVADATAGKGETGKTTTATTASKLK